MTLAHIVPPPSRIRLLEIAGNAIVGGMETSVIRLVERLPPEMFTVTVLCPFDGRFAERLRALGADVVIATMPAEDVPWNSLQTACALIQSRGIDIIHAHLANAHLLAGLAGNLTRTPVVATIHGRQITQQDFEIQRMAATHLHLVCRHTLMHGIGLGVEAARLHHIGNGVDLDVFKPRERDAGALRRSLGVPKAARLVGFVGRLSPEKGPDVFLRVAAVLHQRFAEVHFLLLGDGPMLDELKAQARGAGLQNHVHFAPARDDIAPVYAELEVLASCSHSEAMPLVLMEAMASGLPVVATHVGGVAEIVLPGLTGWLAAPGDSVHIAARVAELLQDNDLRARMSVAAREHAVRHFSHTRTVDGLLQLFSQLVAVGRGRDAVAGRSA